MFPCFDEPALKATFSIDIAHPKDMTALSNNILRESKEEGSLKKTYFEKTPIMQTYLVSVAVGHFESKEIKSNSGVKVS
jgi:puromycin-sensitive aminopeptidase